MTKRVNYEPRSSWCLRTDITEDGNKTPGEGLISLFHDTEVGTCVTCNVLPEA